jgi:hypothetical protein
MSSRVSSQRQYTSPSRGVMCYWELQAARWRSGWHEHARGMFGACTDMAAGCSRCMHSQCRRQCYSMLSLSSGGAFRSSMSTTFAVILSSL